MRYRQVDLNLLLVFYELSQTGSVLRASRSLGVSQGAVSQSLAKLRRHFGDELFIKTNTGVAPTAVALSLVEDVRQAIAHAEAALLGRTRFDPAESDREIKICMGDMGEIRILPRLLTALKRTAPGCRITVLDLWGDELKQGFERGEVDLAISARGPPLGDVSQQKLFDDSYVIMTNQENPLDHEVTIEELSTAPHVGVSPGRLDHLYLEDALSRSGIRRRVVTRVANWVTVPYLLRAEPDLVAIMPSFLAATFGHFELKALRPRFDLPKVEIFQFWHRRSTADPFNVWIRTQVREIFGRPSSVTAEPAKVPIMAAVEV